MTEFEGEPWVIELNITVIAQRRRWSLRGADTYTGDLDKKGMTEGNQERTEKGDENGENESANQIMKCWNWKRIGKERKSIVKYVWIKRENGGDYKERALLVL